MSDLVDEDFARIGNCVRPLGQSVGDGLTTQAAGELGLLPGTPVSVSIIDAHAGGIGMIGAAIGALIGCATLTTVFFGLYWKAVGAENMPESD